MSDHNDPAWADPLPSSGTFRPVDPEQRRVRAHEKVGRAFVRYFIPAGLITIVAMAAYLYGVPLLAGDEQQSAPVASTAPGQGRVVDQTAFAKAANDQRLDATLLKAAEQVEMVKALSGKYPETLPLLGAQSIGDLKGVSYAVNPDGYCIAVWDPAAHHDSPRNALGYVSGEEGSRQGVDSTTMCDASSSARPGE